MGRGDRMMLEKHIEKRTLRTYQTDRYGNMRPLMLMNELQSIADEHAERLGVGRSYCMTHGLAWVVTHYLVDIIEIPREAEELTFTTWPSAQDALRAVRDFEIRGDDGRMLIRATSQWILIDIEKRRPLKLAEHLNGWQVFPQRAYDRTFEKFPDFQSQKSREMGCRYDDVDVNQHINNAVYAVWATESVGFAFRNGHTLRALEINFKKEIKPDTPSVTIETSIDGLVSRHKIISNETENANVICKWDANN